MNNIPTPHISAKAGDFAETVLMPAEFKVTPAIIKASVYPLWPAEWACRP